MPTSSMMTKRMLGVRESSGRSLLSLPPEELELSLQDANPPSVATNTTTATSRIADISCFLVVSPQYVGLTLKAQAVEKGISWVILVAFNRSTLSEALRRRFHSFESAGKISGSRRNSASGMGRANR